MILFVLNCICIYARGGIKSCLEGCVLKCCEVNCGEGVFFYISLFLILFEFLRNIYYFLKKY